MDPRLPAQRTKHRAKHHRTVALSINTNLSSLAVQRALSQSQNLQAAAVQRLSSGLRINAARDDAAGLAISDRLTTQIGGLAQSARNAQDAIGMSQTAEAALASIGDNLQRVRELAVQAANGSNSAAERQSLDAEVRQRVAEIDRIAASTSFGGIKLLDGSAGTLALQVGLGVGDTLGVDLTASLRSDTFGAMASVRSSDLAARLAAPGGLVLGAGDLTIQVGSGATVSVTGTFTTIEALASAVNAAMGGKGSAAGMTLSGLTGAARQPGANWYGLNGGYRNESAFAAVKADGSVVTWGDSSYGGDSSTVASQLTGGVESIHSTESAFAALKTDGSVVTWGNSAWGGNSSTVAAQLTGGVEAIYANQRAFAAVKSDGSVVTWGSGTYGGNSSAVAAQLGSGVEAVSSTSYAFAALKADGSVVTWGGSTYGGDSSAVASALAGNVKAVYGNEGAFAALKTDGSVVTWGNGAAGGNSSTVAAQLTSGVAAIYSTGSAFAALKTDGSVVTWGSSGGDSSTVAAQLSGGVQTIYSTLYGGFAALKADGSVVTWGDSTSGGNSSAVAAQLSGGVTTISSTASAFAAIKADGSVVTWGSGAQGGNSSTVSSKLAGGVRAVYSTFSAFAAVKTDGSVVTWGTAASGGNSSAVAAQLTAGVEVIYSHASAFAALKSDGSVVSWGAAGDSSAVAAQLASGVRSLASPFDEEQSAPGAAAIRQSRVVLSSADAITIGGTQRSILGFAASTQASGSIDAMSTSSVTTANETLRRADVALQSIATQRARVGATLSRFDSLIGDLNTAGSNLTASRSRITDADIAAETAMLTRAQIVQQAGQAMLAQANGNAQMILALLRSDR